MYIEIKKLKNLVGILASKMTDLARIQLSRETSCISKSAMKEEVPSQMHITSKLAQYVHKLIHFLLQVYVHDFLPFSAIKEAIAIDIFFDMIISNLTV